MTTAERLVNQISEFVNGVEHTATPEITELAHQFHDACRALNQRLAKCNDFLRQGMRSEAVQEALAKPSVFELAETFSFKEKMKWQRICRELELPAPPEIDSATVERLKNECGKEELLTPLLHEYRRLVHTGTRDQKIHILRRIRSHDQDNPVWAENLEPLEKEEIKDMERRAADALRNEDEDEGSDILNSLRAPWRAVETPPELTDKLENWLARRRQKVAEQEGDKLLAELNEKLDQRDLPGLSRKLAEWNRLLEHPDFKPTEKMRDQAAQARNWYQSETNRQQRRQEYKQRTVALRNLLKTTSPEHKEIRKQWQELLSFDEEPPEDLKQEVQAVLQELENKAARVRCRRRIFAAAGVIIICGGLAVIGLWSIRFYRTNQARDKIAAMWEEEDYHKLDQYLSELTPGSHLYQAVNGDGQKSRVEEKLTLEKEQQEELTRLQNELQQVADQDYAESENEIESILRQAAELAGEPEEQTAIQNWREEWRKKQEEKQIRLDRQFLAELDEVESELARIREDEGAAPASRIKALTELEDIYQEMKATAETVSPDIQDQFREFEEEMRILQTSLEAEQREYNDSLTRISQAAATLEEWENATSTFLEQFPETEITEELELAADQQLFARDSLALTPLNLQRFPRDTEEIEELENRLAQLPAGENSVWRDPLRKVIAQPALQRRVRQRLEELRQLDFYDLQQVRVRKMEEEEWQTYYIATYFHQQEFDTDNDTFTRYWGRVYGRDPTSLEKEAEHLSVSTETHEVEFHERSRENLIPTARYIRSLLTGLPEDKEMYEYLFSAMDELRDRDDLALVPRALTMQVIGNAVVEGPHARNGQIEEYNDILAGINTEIPWFNQKNEVIKSIKAQVAERLEQLPEGEELAEQQGFQQRLLLASLNRNLEYAGLLWYRKTEQDLQPQLNRAGLNSVLAIQNSDTEVGGYRFVELKLDEEGIAELPRGYSWFPGQPLFAPADARSATEIIQELNPPEQLQRDFPWPRPWPLNVRQLQ